MKRAGSIFGAGLVFRLIVVSYLAHIKPSLLSWGVNEAGGLARWIVTNHSFSSPFHDAHGPSAWLGPAYPLIVAGVFLVFGVQTQASALAMMVFNSVCSAVAGVVVCEIGNAVYGRKAGLFSGWIWALSSPIAILCFILWDTSLSALAFGAPLLLTLRLCSGKSKNWGVCGAIWGFAALVNPALIVPLPILAFLLSERGKRWRSVFIMTLATAVVIMPWTIRNYIVFDKFLLVRSNGLAEVYFANCGFQSHPLGRSMEYQRLGEAAFTEQANARAVECVGNHPTRFLRDSLHRAMLFWIYPINFWPITAGIDLAALVGLGELFRKSRTMAMPLLAVLLAYPLIYYASQVVSRYRHPIEPVLYVLSGIALSKISKKTQPSSRPEE